MSDELKDKFSSDEEYEQFKKSFSDYKNQDGLFRIDPKLFIEIINFQKSVYETFIIQKKKYIQVPDTIAGNKNAAMYMFYFDKMVKENDFDETCNLILN